MAATARWGAGSGLLRAILFDLGQTLIDYGPVDRRVIFRKAARRTYRLWAGRQRRMPDFRRYYLHQWSALHWCHIKQIVYRREMDAMRYIRRACRKLHLAAPPGFFDELAWAWYEPLAETSRLEPGTHELLTELERGGFRLGLVSNTFVPGFVLDRHLRQLDLLRFFPHRIYSCDVGYRKPDGRIFRAALDRLGLDGHQIAFVGDRLGADSAGARRAGLRLIWKRPAGRNRRAPDGVPVVHRLWQLPATLTQVWGKDGQASSVEKGKKVNRRKKVDS